MSQLPIHVLMNTNSNQSLINSVDFHPFLNEFCVTFTHNHSVVIYQMNEEDGVGIIQAIQDSSSKLSCPQHALYSKDGRSLLVVNWCSQTFNVYTADLNGGFMPAPIAVIPFKLPKDDFRPHGMAFSPEGRYLAVAFGASKQHPRGIALYQVNDLEEAQADFQLLDLLQGNEIEIGIPKGIAFSPDGSSLIVTFSNSNSIAIYGIDFSNEKICLSPRQVLKGPSSQVSRPEDIKFTVDGNYCAISNSDKDNITFFLYDKKNNYFPKEYPCYMIKNPQAQLRFPHGLAFSSDGKYLSVTQFGPVKFDKQDNLSSWGKKRSDSIAIYKLM